MRRAGYGVTLLPDRLASHEEAPPDLVSFLARDRRWCAGNMQHVPLVAVPGVPWMMRFHLAYGVIGYWSAPVWLALILLLGLGDVGGGHVGGDDVGGGAQDRADPLALTVLALVVIGLLATKLMGLVRLLMLPDARRVHGGALSLIGKAAGESTLSLALAPILLLRRVIVLAELALSAFLHRPFQGWAPQRRDACTLGWTALVRCHAVETVLGGLVLVAIALGAVSAWMLPVALSWAAAIPLSSLTGVRLGRRRALSRAASSDDRIWGV